MGVRTWTCLGRGAFNPIEYCIQDTVLGILYVLTYFLLTCVFAQSRCHIWLHATPWSVAHQTPLSMEFSRQQYWSELPFPSLGDLPDPGISLSLLHLFHWQVCYLPLCHPGSPYFLYQVFNIFARIRTVLQRIWGVKMLIFPKSRIRKCCSYAQSCSTLCDLMDRSMLGLPVHYQLPELAQTHLHRASDATQTFHPLSPLPPAFNLSQHQGPFKWVTSSYQVAKLLELQLQHQSFPWILRIDIL